MTDQMAPSTVVPVPRNDGMNHRNVLPNRKSTTAAAILKRAINLHLTFNRAWYRQPRAWHAGRRGAMDPTPMGHPAGGGGRSCKSWDLRPTTPRLLGGSLDSGSQQDAVEDP